MKLPAGTETLAAAFPNQKRGLPRRRAGIGEKEQPGAPGGKYVLAKPIHCARRFITKLPGKILCDQKQLYLYSDEKKHWEMADDEPFESILLRDITAESQKIAEGLKIDQLRNFRVGIKHILEKGARRNLAPDTWEGGKRAGEYVSCKNRHCSPRRSRSTAA